MGKRFIIYALLLVAAGSGLFYAWQQQQNSLPAYVAYGNGRLEATEFHVATKAGGRVEEVLVEEGASVTKEDVLARLDTDELKATLATATAQHRSAEQALREATARISQHQSELSHARTRYHRARKLLRTNAVSQQVADDRQNQLAAAKASLKAALAHKENAAASVNAASAEMERLTTLINEATLTAPVTGRIQYRLTEPGEVLPAGGKVATILDLEDVYMTIFLPTHTIGRVYIGSEARIKLDAFPEYVIPASVSFVAAKSQFTPREVETAGEREKLMFRVKVKIPSELLRQHREKVRTGLPGMAYVLLGSDNSWPEQLAVKLPATQTATQSKP